jgi:MbtH protein
MANLLDDAEGTFLVLVNAEGQHSMWPEPIAVPQGWTIVHTADTKQNCLAYVETHWTDMRPQSLREQVESTK